MPRAKIVHGKPVAETKAVPVKKTALIFTWHPTCPEEDATTATRDLGVNVHKWWQKIGLVDVEIVDNVNDIFRWDKF